MSLQYKLFLLNTTTLQAFVAARVHIPLYNYTQTCKFHTVYRVELAYLTINHIETC